MRYGNTMVDLIYEIWLLHTECQKFIASKVPPYMSVPKYVRKYKVSNCGDLCTCHPNGSLSCNTLRCSRESIKKKCIRNGGYQYGNWAEEKK